MAVTTLDKYRRSVEEILDEAREMNLDSIIVVGLYDDKDKMVFKHSNVRSSLRLLGALDMAKDMAKNKFTKNK